MLDGSQCIVWDVDHPVSAVAAHEGSLFLGTGRNATHQVSPPLWCCCPLTPRWQYHVSKDLQLSKCRSFIPDPSLHPDFQHYEEIVSIAISNGRVYTTRCPAQCWRLEYLTLILHDVVGMEELSSGTSTQRLELASSILALSIVETMERWMCVCTRVPSSLETQSGRGRACALQSFFTVD